MRFALVVSALGSALFALAVAGVYELTGGVSAVFATWVLKVAIGAANIYIGKGKARHEARRVGLGGDVLRGGHFNHLHVATERDAA